jgi:hypothetical protein
VEADVVYYRRRISEELRAAERAITSAGRSRHLELIDAFLVRLESIGERLPISRDELARLKAASTSSTIA